MASIEKGTFLLFASNFVFFLASFLMYFFLGRFLLSPAQFGVFAVVVSIVSIIISAFTSTLQQTIAKFVSENPESGFFIRRKLLFCQFLIGLVIAAAYFFSADLIALALNDLSLAPFLRLSSALLLFHPLLGVFQGIMNGRHEFSKLAFFSIFYYALKLAAILLLVVAGFEVFGAVLGFVISSILAVIAGFFITIVPKKEAASSLRRIFYFAWPLLFFAFAIALFQTLDLLAVKALSPLDSDVLAGIYGISSMIAKLPAGLLAAVSTVALPLISGS
ncbi:MAG: oligosaccharide flippase family protein, partial [Candidatus ainarchaeum sp.]|nr:oligosaccharide flippase family protein [Candidatus ainarchaeum sp.]